MAERIMFRQDTSANWSESNPILLSGEFGYDTTLNKFKLGDGVTVWNSLSWWVPILESTLSNYITTNVGGYPRTAILQMTANMTGQNVTTVQPFFSTTQTLATGTYLFDSNIISTNAGTTGGFTTAVMFGGTFATSYIGYSCSCREGAFAAGTPIRPYVNHYSGTTASTATTVTVASGVNAISSVFNFQGVVTITTDGTFIPQFQYSAAPGVAPIIDRASWMSFTKI